MPKPEVFETLHRSTVLAVMVGFFVLERLHRMQRRPAQSATRWLPNVGLFALSSLIGGLLLPASAIALAAGLVPSGPLGQTDLPLAVKCVLGFLALDLLNYGLHRLSHHHPLLWRVHLVHHSDVQLDVTTSVRHHPVEALVNGGLMAALVIVLGLPWQAVAAHAIAALAIAAWSHANLRLPGRLETPLGWVLVTPGMHVQHHSAQRAQTDSNYGTVLSCWDRLFGSFNAPQASDPRALGLEYFRAAQDNTLTALLLRQPFVRRLPAIIEPANWATVPASPSVVLPLPWRKALVQAAIGLCLLAPMMTPTVLTMVGQWSTIEAFRYAWLVLPIQVYALGWHWRDELLAMTPQPSAAGALVVGLGALCWVAADGLSIEVGRQLGLLVMVLGVVLAALGTQVVRRWFTVLALLFYMLPSSDVLQPVLRNITNEGLVHSLRVLGLPVQTEGFLLHVGTNRYFVADACSGLALVTLLAFLGHALGMLVYRSLWRVVAMALLGALLGVLGNLLRVNAIVLIDHWQGSQMDLVAHGHVQSISLLAALALMLLVVACLRPEVSAAAPAVRSGSQQTGAETPIIASPATLGGLSGLLITGLCALLLGLGSPAAMSLPELLLPATLNGWTRSDAAPPRMTPTASTAVAGPAVTRWQYQRDGQRLRLDVLQTGDRREKLSLQALAPDDDAQWQDIRRQVLTVCGNASCLPLIHTTKRRNKSSPLRHSYVAQGVGELVTTSQLQLRAAAAWHGLTGHPVGPFLISLTVEGDGLAPEEAHGLLLGAIGALRAHRNNF